MSKEMDDLIAALDRVIGHHPKGLTYDTLEQLLSSAAHAAKDLRAALRASAVAEPARLLEALEKIGGDREYSAADIASHAQKPHKTIDESVAEDALASLPAPEAAPTREEMIACISKFDVFSTAAQVADAILALKAAPAK